MKKRALFLLALTIFTVISTVATVVAAFSISTPNSLSITKTVAKFGGSRRFQPTGGDPVDNPVLPG